MNTNYIMRALSFHGQPMQKIWDDERGAGDIQKCGIPAYPDYSIYQERQKYFTFQDRAKRLKLHQFFARKALDLYDSELTSTEVEPNKIIENEQYIASLPPYELFVNRNKDKQKRCRCIMKNINPGDIIYCMVTKPNITMVKTLCMGEPMVRYLNDLPIKAYLTKTELDGNDKPRVFNKNDYLRCEVLETSVDAERLYLTLESMNEKNKNIPLGVITFADLPKYYRHIDYNNLEKFEDYMLKSKEFLNPNYDMLYEINGLDVNETYTFMSSLKHPFPRDEYAKELRRTQASKWAFRSVAEGIEHFKNGNHVEAFQCLNKALTIDPRNVEGLVARGALYANKGSFLKAVDDFEKALKLNTYHVNARKYMGETLVALGRRYEDENRIKDATKAYQDCLNIIPNHEQARLSLEAIQQRSGSQYFENLAHLQGEEEDTLEKEKMSVRNSSSDDGSTSSDSGSETEHTDNEDIGKEGSLSPLSKRMALHVASLQKEEESKKQLNQPFYMTAYNVPSATTHINEFRLDDDDTGSRVRKLLQEASKHKKEKKKIKKKKNKKTKKVSRKEKNAANILSKINFQEAYKAISSMNIENKLTENLQKYEKTIADIKKRQEELVQSIEAGMTDRKRSETPPHVSSKRSSKHSASNYPASSSYYASYPSTSAAAAAASAASSNERTKFSFQIKRPVKVDKFGLFRVATPLAHRSPSPRSRSRSLTPSRERRQFTRTRSRSLSRGRYRSRSGGRWNRRRSRSHSITYDGGRRRGSRSRRSSRSLSPHRRSRSSRSLSPYRRSRSRTPSRTRSRSRTLHSRRESSYGKHTYERTISRGVRPSPPQQVNSKPAKPWPRRGGRGAARGGGFGNRVWRRENAVEDRDSNGRWLHDKYEGGSQASKVDDGPSIEEIDEIINKAQKERKQEIIQRDKDILKKPTAGHF
ncbi:tetratricopeptide repeat protein 14 homolog [Bactrocera tryoni]|uniref:tetratricopeptide repeat protein 14 homolog n=1 Tax=Bactrocera tryoni TaxID=59916 RepID=UPI001A95CC4C|nr:tetratricopeptide repeat protein 14 homolog [Bactrocera tryoni]